MLVSVFQRRRVKSLVWLTVIVVLLQLFVFVADQVWSKDAVVEDCSTVKVPGIVSKSLCFCSLVSCSSCFVENWFCFTF